MAQPICAPKADSECWAEPSPWVPVGMGASAPDTSFSQCGPSRCFSLLPVSLPPLALRLISVRA